MVAHYTVTLNGNPQKLSDVITDKLNAIKFISFQQLATNTHVIYVGGTNATLSSSNYGFRLEVPVTSIPPAPSILEFSQAALSLGAFYVLGTNTEKLQILIVTV